MATVRLPRRMRVTALLALLALTPVALAACGGDDDDSATDDETASSDGAFPVTITHEHGETEIPAEPERVVTVGLSDHDTVTALGVTPVAVTDWYGGYDYAAWPWAEEALGDGEPEVLNAGAEWTGNAAYNYEEIATYEPDLIIGLYIDMSEEQYNQLSEIAPVVAPSADYPEYGMPWQETTRVVGQALGKTDEAEALITDVEAQFAAAAEEHPEFEGQEAVVAEFYEGLAFARSATDPRTQFMAGLGFVLPDDIDELAGEEDGAEISPERLDLLDVDGVLVWNIGDDPSVREGIEAAPLWGQLAVNTEGRTVWADDPLIAAALTWSTPLSIPYALEELTPQIAEAFAGNGG